MTAPMPMNAGPAGNDTLASALRTVALEAKGLIALAGALKGDLGPVFRAIIDRLAVLEGRIVVSGMGKSGHIARKIAATFASTGTPSHFVHPAEASHGDLGMIQPQDAILALSWSGETRELADLIAYSRRFRVLLIAITSNGGSALGRQADYCLSLPRAAEACPNGLAPTTSTTLQLVMGDAIAIALLETRGFSAQDFSQFHPGGKLGAQLRTVGSVMHSGDRMPTVSRSTLMSDALLVMSEKGFGCAIVAEPDGTVAGIITDGDLRRHMDGDLTRRAAAEVMTVGPTTTTVDTLLAEALEMMETRKRQALIVIDADRKPVGIIHVLDLLRAGVI